MSLATMPWAQQRQYLQAMGIPVFVARHDLPGAGERCAFIDESVTARQRHKPRQAPAVTATTVVSAVAAPAVTRPEPARSLADMFQSTLPAPSALPSKAVHAAIPSVVTPAATPNLVPFALAMVPVTATEVALLDCPPDAMLDAQAKSLWESICRYYGWQAQVQTYFRWPVAGLPAQDSQVATEALAGWLGQAVQLQRLYFGDRAAAVLPSCRQMPSLDDLLLQPVQKRDVLLRLQDFAPVQR